MPRAPEIRQNILDFLCDKAVGDMVALSISEMYDDWHRANPRYTTSPRAFRQIVYKLREDGYITYESPGHKVSPITILHTQVIRPCPVNGNHVYVCACGKYLHA